MMINIMSDTQDFAKAELEPKLEGMQMVTILIKK
jgi:translation initiation factor IF-3